MQPAERIRLFFRRIAHLVMLLIGCHGCVALELPRYQPPPVAMSPNTQIQDGLAVAVHPILDEGESRKYFGMSLAARNILAVFVVGENRDPSASFILFKEAVSLSATVPSSRPSQEGIKSEAPGEALALTGAALALTGPILLAPLALSVAIQMLSDASVINHNFRSQEFQTKTLSPGQTATGFIYFQLPETTPLPDEWAIQVEAARMPDQEKRIFVFTFRGKGR